MGLNIKNETSGHSGTEYYEADSGYIGQFVENYDVWSGSYSLTGELPAGITPVSITNLCARLTDFIQLDEAECSDVGGIDIRVGDTPFVSAMQESDVAFPTNFPAAPTF